MYIGPWAATHGLVPPRRRNSAHPTIVPFQNFEASDGWFVVGAAKQIFWERLCDVIGRPELNEDERFATMAAATSTARSCCRCSRTHSAPGPPPSGSTPSSPPGVPASRDQHGRGGARRSRRRPPRGRSSSTTTRRSAAFARSGLRCGSRRRGHALERPPQRGPFRGEHTEAVLVDLCGYTPERVRELAAKACSATAIGASHGPTRSPAIVADGGARDLVGYGAAPARPTLAGRRARRAQLRAELRGGRREHTARGRPASEAYLHEVVGAPPTVGRRNLNTESMFEFGSRVGFWRVHRHLHRARAAAHRLRGRPGARAEPGRGACDGRRGLGGREPRLALDRLRRAAPRTRSARTSARSVEAIERVCGVRPVGWYTGRGTEATRRLVVEEGGFLYDSDAYADELPYWVEVARSAAPRRPVHARRQRLQVPAPERFRHRRRLRRRT